MRHQAGAFHEPGRAVRPGQRRTPQGVPPCPVVVRPHMPVPGIEHQYAGLALPASLLQAGHMPQGQAHARPGFPIGGRADGLHPQGIIAASEINAHVQVGIAQYHIQHGAGPGIAAFPLPAAQAFILDTIGTAQGKGILIFLPLPGNLVGRCGQRPGGVDGLVPGVHRHIQLILGPVVPQPNAVQVRKIAFLHHVPGIVFQANMPVHAPVTLGKLQLPHGGNRHGYAALHVHQARAGNLRPGFPFPLTAFDTGAQRAVPANLRIFGRTELPPVAQADLQGGRLLPQVAFQNVLPVFLQHQFQRFTGKGVQGGGYQAIGHMQAGMVHNGPPVN